MCDPVLSIFEIFSGAFGLVGEISLLKFTVSLLTKISWMKSSLDPSFSLASGCDV